MRLPYNGGMSEDNDTKLNLDVPEHLEYSDEHVWVDASVEPAMVGVTEYAVGQFGELVYVDLPEVGTQVEAGDEVAEFESSKAVTALVSPVAGTIRYVNSEAADDPSIVTGDPYGEGWIFKIELEDDEPDLLTADEYAKIVAQCPTSASSRAFSKFCCGVIVCSNVTPIVCV